MTGHEGGKPTKIRLQHPPEGTERKQGRSSERAITGQKESTGHNYPTKSQSSIPHRTEAFPFPTRNSSTEVRFQRIYSIFADTKEDRRYENRISDRNAAAIARNGRLSADKPQEHLSRRMDRPQQERQSCQSHQRPPTLGYTNVYAPILDVVRDPRWGRTLECWLREEYGFDGYVASGSLTPEDLQLLDRHMEK